MMIMRMIRKGDHLHNDYIDNDDNDVEDDYNYKDNFDNDVGDDYEKRDDNNDQRRHCTTRTPGSDSYHFYFVNPTSI